MMISTPTRRDNLTGSKVINNPANLCGLFKKSYRTNPIWIGMEIGYLQKQHATAWVAETQELSAMLVGLMRSLKAANCPLTTQ